MKQKLPHIILDKTNQQYGHLDLNFYKDLSKMKKKKYKANNLQSYINKKQQVDKNMDKLFSNENKSLDCLVRKKKQMCAQSYIEMQKIVENKYKKVNENKAQEEDRIGNNSYSVNEQFFQMKQVMEQLKAKEYLKKKDNKSFNFLEDCDQVILQTRQKIDRIVQKDRNMQKIQQADDQKMLKQKQYFDRQMQIIQRKQDIINKVRVKKNKKMKLQTINTQNTPKNNQICFHDFIERKDQSDTKNNRDQIGTLKLEALKYQKFYRQYFNVENEIDMLRMIDNSKQRQQLKKNLRQFVDNSSTIDFSEYSQFLERRKYFLDTQKYQEIIKQTNELTTNSNLDTPQKEKMNLNISSTEHQQYILTIKQKLDKFYNFLLQMKDIVQDEQTISESSHQNSSFLFSNPDDLNEQTRYKKSIQSISARCLSLKNSNRPPLKGITSLLNNYSKMATKISQTTGRSQQSLQALKLQMD